MRVPSVNPGSGINWLYIFDDMLDESSLISIDFLVWKEALKKKKGNALVSFKIFNHIERFRSLSQKNPDLIYLRGRWRGGLN
jgi:hypothetical protein